MKRIAVTFGGLALAILLLFSLSKWSMVQTGLRNEFWIALFGVAFAGLGILAYRMIRPKQQDNQNTSPSLSPEEAGVSDREFEVLQLIDRGLSNREIADQLYISESTVKTHVSNLLMKLGAKRRTEAVRIGREKGVINS